MKRKTMIQKPNVSSVGKQLISVETRMGKPDGDKGGKCSREKEG